MRDYATLNASLKANALCCHSSVERVLHYATKLEQEAPHYIPEKKPDPEWPRRGALVLKDVEMSYRPGLPPVLKRINIEIDEGEHIGIVGRTGAGKSSIMVALYRLVELNSGSITLDGVDISSIGLADLRTKIASMCLPCVIYFIDSY